MGQAWVPEKGEGTFSTSYNYLSSDGHFGAVGNREPEAAALAQDALFELEYGITDKLAMTFSVPIVTIRYNDTNPPSAFLRGLFDQAVQAVGTDAYKHEFLDDGSYHSSVQDLYFDVRYNIVSRPLVVTPFVGLLIPSHDYAYVGEAAPGRNLREFRFGANVGRELGPLLPKAYLHSQIAFAIPEEALNIRTNRMNVNSEFGYVFNRKFAARGIGNWQYTFNGVRSLDDLTSPLLFLTHERLLKATYWHAGAGFSYAISRKTEISADYVTFVSGSLTHYGKSLTLRISRSFTLGRTHHAATSLPSRPAFAGK
ncbi:MAG TPA: hypothetical protein VF135_06605 [Terriglobales bacterium]